MSLILSLVIIVVFSCITGILSASETAVTMASRLRLHQLAKKGNQRASMLVALQQNMNTLISTIVLTNTCLFAGITALATEMMRKVLGEWGVFIASLLVGAFITFYLEVLPKVYAYKSPEKVGLALAPGIQFLRKALHPVTHFMDWVAHRTLVLFGVKMAPAQKNTTEELRGAIDLHTGEGIVFHERVMLRSILDLSRVTVEEIMVHRKNIVSFNIDTPSAELCQKVLSVPYTRIPLWKDNPDNIIGVVNVKNLARTLSKQTAIDFQGLMKAPWFIPDSSTLFSQLQLFKDKRSHQAFVVDEYGSLLGMVTLEDILEEIVGEITDEHDIDLPGVRVDSHGDYIVQGSVTLRDLHRQYDWAFDEGPSSTLAGLILHETRMIPEVGTYVMIKGFKMKILRRHHHQITLVRVTPPKGLGA